MKKRFCVIFLGLFLLFSGAALAAEEPDTAERTPESAMTRAKAYARAINHDFREPEKIYRFLCSDFRTQMSEAEFVEAFAKERSYPYITPLYIFYPEMTGETETGGYIITFLQAARIEGMTYDIEMVYENDNWYVVDWEQFLDGSYLEKFENIPYSLDWYYDLSELDNGG